MRTCTKKNAVDFDVAVIVKFQCALRRTYPCDARCEHHLNVCLSMIGLRPQRRRRWLDRAK